MKIHADGYSIFEVYLKTIAFIDVLTNRNANSRNCCMRLHNKCS